MIADIHCGKPGRFGPIVVRPLRSVQVGVARGREGEVELGPRDQVGGSAFITLITGKNPNGEIRGQIKVR